MNSVLTMSSLVTMSSADDPKNNVVFQDWFPNNVVFQDWSQPATPKQDPEVLTLEAEVTITRSELKKMQETGRQVRLNRLQTLDALETKRVTLTEILRRMENELFKDTDVYKYGDVLAEVFGERTIFAHRALGLEALLCQFMHQMLAKQHQLKIIKKAAKDIQKLYQKHKSNLKDEFYSFEAQAVQLEASRLTLEALYDDVFTSQHRLLAKFMDVVEGKPGAATTSTCNSTDNSPTKRTLPSLKITTKATEPVTPEKVITPLSDPGENDDMDEAMQILDVPEDSKLSDELDDDEEEEYEVSLSNQTGDDISVDMSVGSFSVGGSPRRRTKEHTKRISEELKGLKSSPTKISTNSSKKPFLIQVRQSAIPEEKVSPSQTTTARERRRKIEHMRLTGEVGTRSGTSHKVNANMYDDDKTSVRARMRELEDRLVSRSFSPLKVKEEDPSWGGRDFTSKDVKLVPNQESSSSSSKQGGSNPMTRDDGDSRSKDSSDKNESTLHKSTEKEVTPTKKASELSTEKRSPTTRTSAQPPQQEDDMSSRSGSTPSPPKREVTSASRGESARKSKSSWNDGSASESQEEDTNEVGSDLESLSKQNPTGDKNKIVGAEF
jgi:hypothetical protein